MKRINWVLMWLVGIPTVGIYRLINWINMADQQNEMAAKVGAEPVKKYVHAWLLGIVTCGIYTLIWYYKFMKQQKALAEAKGIALTPSENPTVLFLLWFVPVYKFYVIIGNYNKLCDAYEAA